MIKVNLLNNRVSASAVDADFTLPLDDGGGESSVNEKEAAVNFILILLFAALLFTYEFFNVGGLKEKQSQAQVRLNQVRHQLAQKEKEIQSLSVYEERAKELENKLSMIKNLSKVRLKAVKALDFLQNLMPEKAWFQAIEYERNRFLLKGFAVSDDDLTEIVQKLERSQYFVDVVLLQAKESKTKNGNLRDFEISCNVGGVE